jgi:AsmA protein
MAHGMKRLGTLAAAALGLLLVGLMAASWLIDRDTVRRAVETQIRTATGLDLVIGGKTQVSVFPASYVTLHQVGFKHSGDSADVLTAEALTANLGLLAILTGHFEITDLSLLNPRINIVRTAEGGSNWAPILDTLARSMKPGGEPAISFSEIRIMQGAIDYRDDARQVSEKLSGIDLSLAWPSIARSFAATGHFDWRGERLESSLSVTDFVAAISGERTGLKARLTGAPLKLAFDGIIANRSSLLLEGTLTADSPSLRNLLRWTGHGPIGDGGFGRFNLKARANVVGESIALTNVNVDLDGNAAEGVLTYNSTTGRPTLQGTLAADTLDLTPYIGTVRLLANGARDWSRQAFDLRSLSATDLDMRLSAAKVTIGSSKLGRTAVGANLRNGALALSVGEAQIYRGIVKGSLGLTRTDDNADIKAQFRFTDIDLEAAVSEMFGARKLSGRGDLGVSLEASGANPFNLAQSLTGTATLTGHDGAISGFNVEQLLRRLERRPLSGAGNYRSGTTPFNTLKVALSIDHGVATADEVQIEGPGTRVAITGTASIPSREYDLKGVASLVQVADAAQGFQLPFVVQGPWDDPLIFPDSDILIRRSPATAPLLDALKGHSARDAVKAVIDRFTGNKKPPSDGAHGGTTNGSAAQKPPSPSAANPPAATSSQAPAAN